MFSNLWLPKCKTGNLEALQYSTWKSWAAQNFELHHCKESTNFWSLFISNWKFFLIHHISNVANETLKTRETQVNSWKVVLFTGYNPEKRSYEDKRQWFHDECFTFLHSLYRLSIKDSAKFDLRSIVTLIAFQRKKKNI